MAAVECELSQVVMSETHDRGVLVLQEKGGTRKFHIVIGLFEVYAIHRFINEEEVPRPLTHELLGQVLKALEVGVEKVIVNDLRNLTFFARLILKKNGQQFDIDSRPSDAIALAVQSKAPIFVEEKVLEEAS